MTVFITSALLLRMLQGPYQIQRRYRLPLCSYEYSILGLEDDFFIGDNDRDWIETGGGGLCWCW